MKLLLYAILLCSLPALQAQSIIAEEDLTYYPRIGMEEATAMDPDSVFARIEGPDQNAWAGSCTNYRLLKKNI